MDLASNRRARHDFEILETFEAGIALTGTEVKSLRNHGGHLQEAYIRPIGNELWLIGASIAPYKFGSLFQHEERRDRKLLMHRTEIRRLIARVHEKGLTLIPLALYLKAGHVKLKLGLGRGKKLYDKRQALKRRDAERRMRRV